MKERRLFFTLTALNAVMLLFSLARSHSIAADRIAPVLKARGFELIDERGHVRAEIKVFPPDPNVRMPDGTTGYPETVLLRLINSRGAPNVKIAATEDGSGVSLGGDSNPTNIQLLARGSTTSLKLTDHDGKQQFFKPQ